MIPGQEKRSTVGVIVVAGLEHRDRAGERGQRLDLAHAGGGDDPPLVLGDQHHAVGARPRSA